MTVKRMLSVIIGLIAVVALVPALTLAQDSEAAPLQADPIDITLDPVAEGLTSPVQLKEAPDDTGRLFVADQTGQIRIIEDGELLDEPFLDVSDRMVEFRDGFDERGLLGFAFHPEYTDNGRFFVYYSAPLRDEAPEDFDHTSHIAEFEVSEEDPNVANADSERIILEVDQPQFNHDGGSLEFSPEDGYLYIALGDGGGGNDVGAGHVEDWYDENEGGNAQNVTENLLGKILRIDVDADEEPYGIPEDNPFVGTDGLDEIYAYGLRNPYRIAFDMGGEGWLLAADAGQDMWEEVNRIESGGNYGWNVREATHCFDPEAPSEPPEDCPATVGGGHIDEGAPLLDPVIEFPHAVQEGGLGVSISAGQMYRGSDLPELEGRYVFATWSMSFGEPRGRLFYAIPSNDADEAENADEELWEIGELMVPEDEQAPFGQEGQEVGTTGYFILGIGQDRDGEVYVLVSQETAPTGETGQVFRLAPAGSGAAPAEQPGPDAQPAPTPSESPDATPTPTGEPQPAN